MKEGVKKRLFTERLMQWHREENHRSLPWKGEGDPYKIWLSEIILQQTRAEQGMPYYFNFIDVYPTVNALAAAPDEEVFRLWQGLGYYNRCKNLLATARLVVNEHGGRFPQSYEGLLSLKGIGPYTAAAIASFAFGLPHAVVDGNVVRVLARYFGIGTPADSTEGKKTFQTLAQELLDKEHSALYNQAIMDLGATVCTPLSPLCPECPLRQQCTAYNQQLIAYLPAKTKKPQVRKRYFHYVWIMREGKVWIQKREGKDIWQNLFQPLLIEADEPLDSKGLAAHTSFKSLDIKGVPEYEGQLKQRLTHQLIESGIL